MDLWKAFSLALSFAAVTAAAPSYAAPGAVLWETAYSSSPGNDSDHANALALDAQGNAVVTGYVEHKDGSHNYLTIKYGPYGTTEWIREYDHSWFDVGRALSLDETGVIVAGSSNNLDNPRDAFSGAYYTDYKVIRYSPAGEVVSEMSASGYWKNNEPNGVAHDKDGNVYVTGTAKNAPDTLPLFYSVKFAPDNTVLWEKFDDFGADSYATGLVLDKDGSIVVGGYYMDARNENYNITVLRYDPVDGKTIRSISYNERFDDEKAHALALDPSGDVVVTGETGANGGVTLTVKLGPDGEVLWASRYGGSEYRNRGNAVRVDGSGRAYVAGTATKDEQNAEWLLLVYDKDGGLLFEKTYPFGGYSAAEDLALDVYGNVVMTGTTRMPNQPAIIRTVRVEGLPPVWESQVVRPEKVFDKGRRIALTAPRPMLRKVNLAVSRGRGGDGQCVSLVASPAGMPGDYEYRFFTCGRNSAHHWEKLTDYSKRNFIVFNPGTKADAPVKVMVEVRGRGSALQYEARQEVVLQ